MVDDQGRVLGVVFGAAVDDSDTGFVLTAQEVSRQLNRGCLGIDARTDGRVHPVAVTSP